MLKKNRLTTTSGPNDDGHFKTEDIPEIAPTFRFQWEEARGCHVILYPEGMVKLNPAAGEILKRCDGDASDEEVNNFIAGNASFQHKLEMARLVKRYGHPMVLCFVLHRHNKEQVEQILDLAHPLEADYVELTTTQYYGWGSVFLTIAPAAPPSPAMPRPSCPGSLFPMCAITPSNGSGTNPRTSTSFAVSAG